MYEIIKMNQYVALSYFSASKEVDEKGVVLLLHGAIENSRIFYPKKNWGLAPYLAQQGYVVYCLDLKGRGQSMPAIDASSGFGQTQAICEDIPLAFEFIRNLHPETKQIWMAHSWGGVLMASTLARFPQIAQNVASQVYFGTKRRILVHNLARWIQVDLYWKFLCKLATARNGYLPKKFMGIGSDAETKKSHAASCEWIKPKAPWIDTDDGFDYQEAIRQIKFPRTLFLAGMNDACLGNPKDVALFMGDCGGDSNKFVILAKENGNKQDYDHINMLTHPDCYEDHFSLAADWVK